LQHGTANWNEESKVAQELGGQCCKVRGIGCSTAGNAILSEMLSATKNVVAAFKVNTSLKSDEICMKTHDKWMKIASMYISCVKQDVALTLALALALALL
jgi:hypothetical protein